MSVSTDIRTFLINNQVLSDLVGTRIYPMILPQDPVYPAITYSEISNVQRYTFDGPDGIATPRIQFDVWAETYLVMEEVVMALRDLMDGFRGYMGTAPGTQILGVFFATESEFYEASATVDDGSGRGIYRRSIDYFINYKED